MNVKKILTIGFSFVAGGVIGFVIGKAVTNAKWDKIIEAMDKEYYGETKEEVVEETEEVVEEEETEQRKGIRRQQTLTKEMDVRSNSHYDNILSQYKGEHPKEEIDDSTPPDEGPYIIPPYEMGVMDGFDVLEFTYYEGDDVLLTNLGEVLSMEDRDKMVGEEALNSFGEYEDEAVHVRNIALKTDFEILYDAGRWIDTQNQDDSYPIG